jgi:hypothetical protein
MITGRILREMFPNGAVMAYEYAMDISIPTDDSPIHPGIFHNVSLMSNIVKTMDLSQRESLRLAAIRYLSNRINSITAAG